MATLEATSTVQRIGETAGEIWRILDTEGPMKMTQLVKQANAPRDVVMQAVGWLAREEKITVDEQSRSRFISLC
ncbi:MAG: winged helix-turn-helix domain-containing protein [Planctomycetales bacterium]|nr:winged helix-turn-helix domain-containing protein [Planctomycetales bacterium]